MKKEDFVRSFECSLYENMQKGSAVLVALSGGADSSVLLSLMNDAGRKDGFPLYAAHVNHNIRGDEALRDMEFCKRLCDSYGIPLFILDTDVPARAAAEGKGIEECARDVRYGFFASLMREHGIETLAVAHNADDNLETVIFNLVRGSGTKGLSGIPPTRRVDGGRLIRPLLFATKEEIIAYATECGIEYVTDSTNADTDYTRNHIRANIVPALKKIGGEPEKTAFRLSGLLRADNDFIERCAESVIEENCIGDFAPLSLLRELDDALFYRVIARMCPVAFEYVHIAAIRELVAHAVPHSRLSLPSRMVAEITDGALYFSSEDEYRERNTKQEPFIYELSSGENIIKECGISINVTQTSQKCENIYKNFIHTAIPFDKIKGRLYVRNRREGDRYEYGGMTRSVKKLFCDKKIPPQKRDRTPIICDDDGILWIPGFPARYVCEKNEHNMLYIYIENKEE